MNKTSLSPGLQKFCERVRIMNQTNSKNLVLTVAEARNLESDIMDLLILIKDQASTINNQSQKDIVEIEIQSPSFK